MKLQVGPLRPLPQLLLWQQLPAHLQCGPRDEMHAPPAESSACGACGVCHLLCDASGLAAVAWRETWLHLADTGHCIAYMQSCRLLPSALCSDHAGVINNYSALPTLQVCQQSYRSSDCNSGQCCAPASLPSKLPKV